MIKFTCSSVNTQISFGTVNLATYISKVLAPCVQYTVFTLGSRAHIHQMVSQHAHWSSQATHHFILTFSVYSRSNLQAGKMQNIHAIHHCAKNPTFLCCEENKPQRIHHLIAHLADLEAKQSGLIIAHSGCIILSWTYGLSFIFSFSVSWQVLLWGNLKHFKPLNTRGGCSEHCCLEGFLVWFGLLKWACRGQMMLHSWK